MTATDTFIATLTQTPPDAGALLTSLNQLNNDLGQIITVLNFSKEVDDDLANLDNALTVTMEALDVVEVIPEVGEAAAAFGEAVTAMSEEVKPAHSAADNIENEVKPFRDAFQNVQSKLGDLINAVTKVQTDSQTFLTDFTGVVNCINSLPDGTYKTQGLSYLDGFSGTAQPAVSGLNDGMTGANSAITTFYSELKQLEAALSPLQAISSAIDEVMEVLSPVTNMLSQLENDLNNLTISIPLGFYTVTVPLLKIFNEFTDFINLAMEPIQGLVDDLLNALNVSLPQIPGLSDLINLQINIPGIPDFDGLLAPITTFLNQLEGLIPSFSLACPPPSPDAQVPGGGVFKV